MGSAASVVDSHPLLPTPVIRRQPCDSSLSSRGWLAGWVAEEGGGGRGRGEGGYGNTRQGDASPVRDGGRCTAERRHGSAYLHPHPPACTAGAADGDDSTRLLL